MEKAASGSLWTEKRRALTLSLSKGDPLTLSLPKGVKRRNPGLRIEGPPTRAYLPQLSLSPVILLNTGLPAAWSWRSVTK